MLEFTHLVRALDESVSDATEAVIVITSVGDDVIVRAFGAHDDVIDALKAALAEITSPHRPRDLRPN